MSLVLELFVCGLAGFVLLLNGLFFLVEKFRNKKVSVRPAESIVVITGCDSGFGEMTSRRLAELGYQVVSACLTDEGVKRLKDTVAVSVKCDVTKEEDVAALALETEKFATSSGCRVWGVVNNAGIGDGGNLDWTELRVWRRVMEVNFFAVVSVTRAFLSQLKKTPESRVINVSSMAGLTGSAALGAYCASKHAVEGMAKCVRQELAHWSIHVSNINPAFMRTPILTNGPEAAKRVFEAAPASITSEYTTDWIAGQLDLMNKTSEDPVLVVDAIVAALTDSHPPMWYFPGRAAQVLRIIPTMCSGVVDAMGLLSVHATARPTAEAMKKYRS